MTESDAPPQTNPAPATSEPVPAAPEPPGAASPAPAAQRSPGDTLPWLYAIGFVVLAGAIGFVGWSSAQRQAQPSPEVQALANRVARLEQRPAPGQAADLGPLETRVTALEQRSLPDLAPLQARVAALQQQAADAGQTGARIDALSARVAAAVGRDRDAEGDLTHRLEADEARLAALEQSVAETATRLNQAVRLARIATAQAVLAAGQPLGDLPGAPAALARFATAAPPTMAALRLSFTPAENAALAAAQPDAGNQPFLAGMLARAQDLITVRQGDRVLLGSPAAGVLARARIALDAGDLAGAVAAVAQLSGPPAATMANWLADARALLAARAALADMAAHG